MDVNIDVVSQENSYRNEVFLHMYKNAVAEYGAVVNGLIKNTTEDCREWEQMAWHVVELLNMNRDGDGALSMLSSIRTKDNDTFIHSVNVAMICYDIAKWVGMNRLEREEASLCGLLHDVGKLTVPPEVLKKPGKLSIEERVEIKKHPLLGFYSLLFFRNENVRLAALQHHERYDGSGYPFGEKGDNINKYAQIVAIADVYDALTANRVYRKAMPANDALKIMWEEKEKFSPIYFPMFYEKALILASSEKRRIKTI